MRSFYLSLLFLASFSSFSQTIIFSENFQNGRPSTFTIIDNDGNTPASAVAEFTSAWISKTDPNNTIDTVAASTSFFSPEDTASRWLITPSITLGGFGNYFSWEARSHDPSFPDDYLVLLSTTDNLITSFTDTIGFVVEENFEWTFREVDLSEQGYNNQSIYIAFVNKTYDGFKLYLDDFEARKEDVTGINVNVTNAVTVYPNPSNDKITISSTYPIEKIVICNASGSMLFQTDQLTIDISQLPVGFYYARVYSANASSTVKFIKQ